MTTFYCELEEQLSYSTGKQRKEWAKLIHEQHLEIEPLTPLLLSEPRIALRFSWLLTDIGMVAPERLRQLLPLLLEMSQQIKHFDFRIAFATYWRTVGVPEENEAIAIDWLLMWLQAAEVNVTTKTRALFALAELAKKYPAIKNEIRLILVDQIPRYSNTFAQSAQKVLNQF